MTEGVDLSGKVAIVTGTTSGIGVETALALAARGAHVILAARNRARLAESRKSIAERLAEMGVQAQLTELLLDLADLESVAEFVRRFKALKLPLHILVNNAGVMALPPSKTKQGFEMQVGVNHLGHFALFSGLLDVLKTSAPSRVVALSSSAIRLADRKFLDHPKLDTVPYYPWGAYGNSKMSNFFFAREANRRSVIRKCEFLLGGLLTRRVDFVVGVVAGLPMRVSQCMLRIPEGFTLDSRTTWSFGSNSSGRL